MPEKNVVNSSHRHLLSNKSVSHILPRTWKALYNFILTKCYENSDFVNILPFCRHGNWGLEWLTNAFKWFNLNLNPRHLTAEPELPTTLVYCLLSIGSFHWDVEWALQTYFQKRTHYLLKLSLPNSPILKKNDIEFPFCTSCIQSVT